MTADVLLFYHKNLVKSPIGEVRSSNVQLENMWEATKWFEKLSFFRKRIRRFYVNTVTGKYSVKHTARSSEAVHAFYLYRNLKGAYRFKGVEPRNEMQWNCVQMFVLSFP